MAEAASIGTAIVIPHVSVETIEAIIQGIARCIEQAIIFAMPPMALDAKKKKAPVSKPAGESKGKAKVVAEPRKKKNTIVLAKLKGIAIGTPPVSVLAMSGPKEEGFNFVIDDYNPLSIGMLETTLSENEMLALALKDYIFMVKEQATWEESDSSKLFLGNFTDDQRPRLLYVYLLSNVKLFFTIVIDRRGRLRRIEQDKVSCYQQVGSNLAPFTKTEVPVGSPARPSPTPNMQASRVSSSLFSRGSLCPLCL